MSLQTYMEFQLKPTWLWLLTVMDATEAQLRFGASLTSTSDPAHPSHPLHAPLGGTQGPTAARPTLPATTARPRVVFTGDARTRDREGKKSLHYIGKYQLFFKNSLLLLQIVTVLIKKN